MSGSDGLRVMSYECSFGLYLLLVTCHSSRVSCLGKLRVVRGSEELRVTRGSYE